MTRRIVMPVWILLLASFLVISWAGVISVEAAVEPLQLTLDQYVVIAPDDENDREKLIPFDGESGAPGTEILYQLAAKNNSDEPLNDVILTLPVPGGTQYVERSENLDRSAMIIQFSIDGGADFRLPPLRYAVQDEDGNTKMVMAGPEMITHLRLVFLRALAAGEEVGFSYRVVVN